MAASMSAFVLLTNTMHDSCKLTVVLTTYNRRALLERALTSVLNQIRGDKRICIHIWDNNSFDDTEKYIREMLRREENVRYTRRPENIGALGNYMDAISRVETEFYVNLADDDYLLDGFLKQALEILEADQALGAVVMQTLHVNPAGQVTKINPGDGWGCGRHDPPATMRSWCELGHFEWSSIVFRKSVYNAVGGLNLQYGLATDVAYQMAVFLRYPIQIVKYPAAVYSIHDEQQSSNLGMWYFKAATEIVASLRKTAASKPEFETALRSLKVRYAKSFSKLGSVTHSFGDLMCLIRGIGHSLGMPRYAAVCLLRAVAEKVKLRSILPLRKNQAPEHRLGTVSDYASDIR
ncbi:MAG: glycosyltransferase family 2 protein [Chitinophagaceae bacterium]|nr:MAG: glycosyltransferase family 2 protein [Chitinophagaceae bacterium]